MATVQIAVVQIGYEHYLLPRAKALKVAELMGEAVKADGQFGADYTQTWTAGSAPEVGLKLIEPHQVVMPEGVVSPTTRRRTARPALKAATRLIE